MSSKVISVTEETKAKFETLQRALSFKRNHDLTQDEVLIELITAYGEVNP